MRDGSREGELVVDLKADRHMRDSIPIGSSLLIGDIWSPFGAGVRTDPRFKEVVRVMGLDAYWRSSSHWSEFCKPVGADDFECH